MEKTEKHEIMEKTTGSAPASWDSDLRPPAEVQGDLNNHVADEIKSMVPQALNTYRELLTIGTPSVRKATADTVLEMSGTKRKAAENLSMNVHIPPEYFRKMLSGMEKLSDPEERPVNEDQDYDL